MIPSGDPPPKRDSDRDAGLFAAELWLLPASPGRDTPGLGGTGRWSPVGIEGYPRTTTWSAKRWRSNRLLPAFAPVCGHIPAVDSAVGGRQFFGPIVSTRAL